MAGGHRPCTFDCSIIWAFMRTSWKLRAAVRNSSDALTSAGIQMHSASSLKHHQGPQNRNCCQIFPEFLVLSSLIAIFSLAAGFRSSSLIVPLLSAPQHMVCCLAGKGYEMSSAYYSSPDRFMEAA